MEFFRTETNIDFMGAKKITAIFSGALVIISLFFLLLRGLNLGLDFTGGYELQIAYNKTPNIEKLSYDLETLGFKKNQITAFGSNNNIMVKLPAQKEVIQIGKIDRDGTTSQQIIKEKIANILGNNATISSLNYIGPQVGEELATNGILALLVAMICIVGYIAFRFEMKFAISAGIALLHDPIVILGVFSIFQLDFSLTTLAAILAVIGYSLNDTVVIYDRIRENLRKMADHDIRQVVNRSVNDTLSRTIMTSGLTLLVVIVLYFFGGPSLHEFSLALILGVIIGTYSSIYIAGVLAVILGIDRRSLLR